MGRRLLWWRVKWRSGRYPFPSLGLRRSRSRDHRKWSRGMRHTPRGRRSKPNWLSCLFNYPLHYVGHVLWKNRHERSKRVGVINKREFFIWGYFLVNQLLMQLWVLNVVVCLLEDVVAYISRFFHLLRETSPSIYIRPWLSIIVLQVLKDKGKL